MTIRTALLPALGPWFLAALVTACQSVPSVTPPDLGAFTEPEIIRTTTTSGPPGAAPGSCWGRDVTPAVVETVTEQVVLQPAEVLADGTVVNPAVYRTETRQKIVKERRETWFETPCPEVMTPEFVATLQRALAARGHYRGAINSSYDKPTRAAVRRYQKPEGLDSGILSLEAAKWLGLVAVGAE
ncbi:peptidoglycan-binding domain-containing protein [Shimia biformata]|uniref:peptidoglycan-binding domain-containing protein n=1 Tax=Shimia biformata TaxID=1294299 RepID=UPI00194FA17B|nr:peptidoglycan-binding domain-containing protein [Shimia biformata]